MNSFQKSLRMDSASHRLVLVQHDRLVRVSTGAVQPRRHKLHIPRFRLTSKARSFSCSSSLIATRYTGRAIGFAASLICVQDFSLQKFRVPTFDAYLWPMVFLLMNFLISSCPGIRPSRLNANVVIFDAYIFSTFLERYLPLSHDCTVITILPRIARIDRRILFLLLQCSCYHISFTSISYMH